jgi:DNA-binding transcriptional LysR family regulator
MKNINLNYLQTFITVMERGSFSVAAERLNITQPAVSLQIRQLERSLGATLIERIGRKAKPTAAGAELLAHADRIDAAVSSALAAVAQRATGAMGRVRLGTGATACIFLLPPMLRDLRQKYPDLEITVTTGNTVDIVRAIEENILDIGLVTMPVSGRAFDITPVMDDEFVVIAPLELKLPARVTAAVLSTKPVLLFEPGGNTRRIADAWFAGRGISLKPVMSLGSVEAIKELVGAGLGCAILPGMAVRKERDRSDLIIQSLSPRLHRKLAVLIRRDKRLDAGLKDVFRALKALSE